jgi:hypothetical protein
VGAALPAIFRDTGLRDTKEKQRIQGFVDHRKTKNTEERTSNVPGGEKNELGSSSTSKTSYTAS